MCAQQGFKYQWDSEVSRHPEYWSKASSRILVWDELGNGPRWDGLSTIPGVGHDILD